MSSISFNHQFNPYAFVGGAQSLFTARQKDAVGHHWSSMTPVLPPVAASKESKKDRFAALRQQMEALQQQHLLVSAAINREPKNITEFLASKNQMTTQAKLDIKMATLNIKMMELFSYSDYQAMRAEHALKGSKAKQNDDAVDSSWSSMIMTPALSLVAAQQTGKKLKPKKDPNVELQQQLQQLKIEETALKAMPKPETEAEFMNTKKAQLQFYKKYCVFIVKRMELYSFSDFKDGKQFDF